MESILPKSMIKLDPNSPELSELIAVVPLLEVENGRVLLHEKGMKIIESQILGDLHLVALEGNRQNLLYSFYRSQHVLNKHNQ